MPVPHACPDLMRPEDGYVFVVTYGRSGSTLTQAYLNSFDGVCVRGENANLLYGLFTSARRVRREENYRMRRARAGRQDGTPLSDILGRPDDPWYGAEAVEFEPYAAALLDVFVREVLRLPEGTRLGGFKEIRWMERPRDLPFYLDFLAGHFPKARFLIQTRDGRQVARSGWWKTHPEAEVRAMVEAADAAFLGWAEGRADCLHVDYADLAGGLDGFRRIAAFIGRDFDAAAAEAVAGRRLTHMI